MLKFRRSDLFLSHPYDFVNSPSRLTALTEHMVLTVSSSKLVSNVNLEFHRYRLELFTPTEQISTSLYLSVPRPFFALSCSLSDHLNLYEPRP